MPAQGIANATNNAYLLVQNPVPMRAIPTSLEYSTLILVDYPGSSFTVTGIAFDRAGSLASNVSFTASGGGLTVGRSYKTLTNNSLSGYLGFSAEL
jgi:hypothetical protein